MRLEIIITLLNTTNMKNLFLVLVAICSVSLSSAQNLKFGKPSQMDWTMVGWSEAPDAEAVVLCKTLKTTYELVGSYSAYDNSTSELSMDNYANSGMNKFINEGNTTMTYEVKMRTKILKDSGTGYANIDIVYFDDEKVKAAYDEFKNFSVVVFKNENGKVKKIKQGKEIFKDERLNENYKVRHVVVPDVKAGDIIEYQYDLYSKRVTFLYDWQVQEDKIPVMYSLCDMDIPLFLQFNMQVPKHPFVKSKVEEGLLFLPQEGADLQAPKRCKTNHYTIEVKDMLPRELDLQRNQDKAQVAQVEGTGKIQARINVPYIEKPVDMPTGKYHIMVNP